jgi:hypothetical protein
LNTIWTGYRVLITSNEEGIASENRFVIAIFKEEAYAVLGMAGCVQSRHFDTIANTEGGFVRWCLCDFVAVFPPNYWKRVGFELVDNVNEMKV